MDAIWRALLHRLLLSGTSGGSSSQVGSPAASQRRRLSSNRKTARGLELTIATCLGRLYMRLASTPVNPSLNITASTKSTVLQTPHTVDYTYFPLGKILLFVFSCESEYGGDNLFLFLQWSSSPRWSATPFNNHFHQTVSLPFSPKPRFLPLLKLQRPTMSFFVGRIHSGCENPFAHASWK